MTDPRIEPDVPGPRDDRAGFLVHTPFDAAFVIALKASIPMPDRVWCEAQRAWCVAQPHQYTVVRLCLEAFDRGGTFQQERLI